MLRRVIPLAFLALALALPLSQHAESASGRLCEARGVCHAMAHTCSQQVNTQVLAVGQSSFTIPAGVTLLSKVSAFAAGGGANNGAFGGGAGGGGGAYSEVDNVAVTPGNSLALSIGTHGAGGAISTTPQSGTAGGDTSVSYLGSQILLAKGGGPGTSTGPGAGGQAASGVGTIKHSGGTGGNGVAGGGGGGGAGGPDGDGQVGQDAGGGANANTGGAGGGGDNGLDGAGGTAAASSPGGPGGTGHKFGTAGSGGGGGGADDTNSTTRAGGKGGALGGGGGAASQAQSPGSLTSAPGGDAGDGGVVVQFTFCGNVAPPPPRNSFFVATNGIDSNPGTLAAPFLTFGQCQSAMRNSATTKTCTIRAGTYSFGSQLTLTQADNGETWQFFSADGVDTPLVTGNGGVGNLFECDSCQNVTWNGLSFAGFQTSGIHATGGGANPPASGNTVINSIFDGSSQTNNANNGAPIWFELSTGNCTIKHNYTHDTISNGIRVIPFNSGDTDNGCVIDSNVVLNAVKANTDDGAIYLSGHSQSPSDFVSVTNNFVQNYGSPGHTDNHCIYLDDFTSNVTVKGNICGAPVPGAGANSLGPFLIHNGRNNTISGNIIDLGSTGQAWNAVYFADNGSVDMSNNRFTGNIVVSKYAGAVNTSFSGVGGQGFFENNVPGSDFTISASAYHNYGGGAEPTGGPSASDGNPQHISAANLKCSGSLYTLDPTSTAFAAPVNFTAIVGGWGPPGFVIPTSTNSSCSAIAYGVNIHQTASGGDPVTASSTIVANATTVFGSHAFIRTNDTNVASLLSAAGTLSVIPILTNDPTTCGSESACFTAGFNAAAAILSANPSLKYLELGNEYDIPAGCTASGCSNTSVYQSARGLIAGMQQAVNNNAPSVITMAGDAGFDHFTFTTSLFTDLAAYPGHGDLRPTWAVMHWYQDGPGGNDMGDPLSCCGGFNVLQKHKDTGRPIAITEFGAGNVHQSNATAASRLTTMMQEWHDQQVTYNIVLAEVYELYQNAASPDWFLYNPAATLFNPQGTSVQSFITTHGNPFP